MLPAATGFGLAELVTLRSACVALATPTVTEAELLSRLLSCVVVARVAVSVMSVPEATLAPTSTVTLKVLLAPGAMVGLVQLIEPVVVQVHPAGELKGRTRVVLVGIASVSVALAQLLGPVLVTTCV